MTVYGRLDVFWPDGGFDSYMLEQPTISVGRADGNVVTLETEALSRYHFSITFENDKVILTDLGSVNGTFIEGGQLAPHEPHYLEGVEEVQAGHLRFIYYPADQATTAPMMVKEDSYSVDLAGAGCVLALDINQVDVWPASSSSTELAITNTTRVSRRFTIALSGIQEKWIRVNRPELEIYPGETSYVLINVKPPRHPEVAPQTYNVNIRVTPGDNPDVWADIPLAVTIRGYSGLGVALGTKQVSAGESVRMYLHNQGNEPIAVQVSGSAPKGALRFTLPTAPVVLSAGQRIQVTGEIHPMQRRYFGAVSEVPFHLHAKAQNSAAFLAVVEGRVTIKPVLPVWMIVAGAAGALAVLLLIGLIAVRFLNPAEPIITEFTLLRQRVAQGDPLELVWEAENALRFTILMNNIDVGTVLGTENSYAIDTSEFSGTVSVSLVAHNSFKTTTQSVQGEIFSPLDDPLFTVEPATLLNNVVQTLDIEWDVPGATNIQILGLESFRDASNSNAAQLLDEYPTEGRLEDILVIPTLPIVIIMQYTDAEGNVRDKKFTILPTDPTCTAIGEVALLTAPEDDAPARGTASDGETLVADRQVDNGEWLRVARPGGERGWVEADEVICVNIFDPRNLRAEVIVPTPTASPSPVGSVTPAAGTPTATQVPAG